MTKQVASWAMVDHRQCVHFVEDVRVSSPLRVTDRARRRSALKSGNHSRPIRQKEKLP